MLTLPSITVDQIISSLDVIKGVILCNPTDRRSVIGLDVGNISIIK